LRDLSEQYGVDLHKGAGEPVDRAARRFVALHGREGLIHVAKLHFKNTSRV
jgi:ribonuclease HIII